MIRREEVPAVSGVGDAAEIALNDNDRYDHPKDMISPCVACDAAGVELVMYELPARWPSGRYLRGHIQIRVPVCQEHFEVLAQGGEITI